MTLALWPCGHVTYKRAETEADAGNDPMLLRVESGRIQSGQGETANDTRCF